MRADGPGAPTRRCAAGRRSGPAVLKSRASEWVRCSSSWGGWGVGGVERGESTRTFAELTSIRWYPRPPRTLMGVVWFVFGFFFGIYRNHLEEGC